MIKLWFFILATVAICLICNKTDAQTNKSSSLLLANGKPSVFITFDHKGKAKPLFEGESNDRTWLKIHNNTKLKIFLCSYFVNKEYGDAGLFYEVERFAFFNDFKNTKTPKGYGNIDTCDVFTLNSGKSILFSLPSESLAKGLRIKTKLFYGWTGDWKEDIYEGTFTFVKFGSDELPIQISSANK